MLISADSAFQSANRRAKRKTQKDLLMQEMYPTTEDDTQLIRFHTDQSYVVTSNKEIPDSQPRPAYHQGRLDLNQATMTRSSSQRGDQD